MSEQNKIKGISQETCDKLNKQFENLILYSEKQGNLIEQTIKHIQLTVFNSMMDKLEHYSDKMIKSTFITRWYWKRKFDEHLKKIAETTDLFKKLDEEKRTNNNGHYND